MGEVKLHRHIGLGALIVYGVGDILGAGIYGLIGKAAGEMGNAVWMAFLASMVAAGLTGLSYASLGSRYPYAGGAAFVTHRAFHNKFLAYVIGLAALASGITSMAAGSRAFAGYFSTMLSGLPVQLIIALYCVLVASVVIRGIKESMWMNFICTSIELSGLLIVIIVGAKYLGTVNYFDAATTNNPGGDLGFSLIMSGAVLTFYSFVGFEDIINVGEEVKNPERNIPVGILTAVSISSVVYVLISLVAVSVLRPAELSASAAPLVDVVIRAAPSFPPILFSVIAMFAVANTALLNFVMGSRLMYGMAGQGLLPKILGRVSAKRRTPYVSSLVLLAILLVLALSGDIASLARATSLLLLVCFFAVNLSLIVLKFRKGEAKGKFEIPAIIPALGAIVCAIMLFYAKMQEIKVAGILFVVIAALYFILRPKDKAIAALKG